MTIIWFIIDILFNIGWWFWEAALNVHGIPLVGDALYWVLIRLATLFYHEDDYGGLVEDCIAYYVAELGNWIENIEKLAKKALNWDEIQDLIRDWLEDIELLIEWFTTWITNVVGVIDDWWLAATVTVKAWIKVVADDLDDLIEAWSDFWNNILPNLVNFTWLADWWNTKLTEISDLIESTIRTWFPFYDDLVRLWDSIMAFITDPLEWLWGKFSDWFLGGG